MQNPQIVKFLTLSWSRPAKPYRVAYNIRIDLSVVSKELAVAGSHATSHLELVRV